MQSRSILFTLAALAVLLLAAHPGLAQGAQEDSGALSQYITGKNTDENSLTAANPLTFPMVTFLVLRDEGVDGDPDMDACDNGPCAVCVSGPKGTDDDCFDDKCSSIEERGMYQAVSVPMSGVFRRSGRGDLGVLFFTKRQTFGTGVEPFLLQLGGRVQQCLCDELADEGLAPDLFSQVPGLKACPTT